MGYIKVNKSKNHYVLYIHIGFTDAWMVPVGQKWCSMILWSPKNILPNIWFKRNKPQKNIFDTSVTARKLLKVLPFKPWLLASKGTRTDSSINHFFPPIFFLKLFSLHFSSISNLHHPETPVPVSRALLLGSTAPVPSAPARRRAQGRSRGRRSPV